MSKVTGVLAGALTGDIKAMHTNAVIDLIVKVADIALPKRGNTLVIDMLGEINQRLDKILEGQEEMKQYIAQTLKIERLIDHCMDLHTLDEQFS
ncbi:hypothetical protein FRC05_007122 [Tulasnella sp. 425]|nr:hypothetical protein FRC05_007122 [Tulasnella sp. 425]